MSGVRQGLMIDSSVLVNALSNNALKTPKELHVQRAVFEYEEESLAAGVKNDQAQQEHGSHCMVSVPQGPKDSIIDCTRRS